MTAFLRSAFVAVGFVSLAGGCGGFPDPAASQTGCPATDPRVGQTAVITGKFHGVSGTARIVDNCTIVIEHFYFDGIGLDDRVIGFKGEDYTGTMKILTSDIRRVGGYTDETLVVKLPQGITLDDVPRISICCVPVHGNLGDGTFE